MLVSRRTMAGAVCALLWAGCGDAPADGRDAGRETMDSGGVRDGGSSGTDGGSSATDGGTGTDSGQRTDAARGDDGGGSGDGGSSATDGGSVSCGPTTCAAGEVCCNESCGVCTPPDGFCTDEVCLDAGTEPDGGGSVFACGTVITCASDIEYCQVVAGGVPGGMPSYACHSLPDSCASPPTCASCFPGSPGVSCTDTMGEIRVFVAAP